MSDPEIFVDCVCPLWLEALPGVEDACRRVAAVTLGAAAGLSGLPLDRIELGLMLTDDAQVQSLNRDYRGQDKPTNVLSFAALDEAGPVPEDGPVLLGDVVIAYETVMSEAAEQDKEFEQHLSHLVVHGVLHLLGYDHMTEDEAERMESLERSILGALNIPDPYQDRRS
jgi:probable rRNA maturation factor